MSKEYLISIIIPVYNKEPYLRECLDSVLNQSYKNLEVICIDDGSTDSSISILEEYVSKDKRVSLFKSEHKGPSAARNIGIKQCHGDYIHFMDADDVIKNGCYENIIKIIKNENNILDIVKFYIDWSNNINNSLNKDTCFISKFGDVEYKICKLVDNADFLIYENHNLLNKIIRKEIIKANNLCFNEDLKYFEDGDFFYKCLSLCNLICYSPYNFYLYRQNVNNRQSSKIKEKEIFIDNFQIFDDCFVYFENRCESLKISFIKDYLKSLIDDADRVVVEYRLEVYEALIKFVDYHKNNCYFQQVLKLLSKEISNIFDFYFKNKKEKNSHNPLISIIIPIYNKLDYIDECITSIINQSYDNLQIICVDDCSTDGSFEFVKRKFGKDKKIVFVSNEKNMGLCESRNKGIEFATGEYIHFVDADDIIKQNSYQIIVNILNYLSNNIDLICFYMDVFDAKTHPLGILNVNSVFINELNNVFSLISLTENPDFYLHGKGGGPSASMKLFKTKIVKENNILFDQNISFNEDLDYCFRYFQYVSTSLSLAYDFYNYRINIPGQMMDKVLNTTGKYSLLFKLFDKSKEFYYSKNNNVKLYFLKSILETAFNNYLKIYNHDARYRAMIDLIHFIDVNKSDEIFICVMNDYSFGLNILKFNCNSLISNVDYCVLNDNTKKELSDKIKELDKAKKDLGDIERKFICIREEFNNTIKELDKVKKDLEINKQQLHSISKSNSYKIGRKITYPIRKIKKIFKH